MAISSHPRVTEAALQVLDDGGNAADALLAAALVQTVVEPHMTTITGMFSMLWYDARSKAYTYCNGGMNAPLAALPGFGMDDLATGRGVPVPGWWAAFCAIRERFGTMSGPRLAAPAVTFAREGFACYPFLFAVLFTQMNQLVADDARAAYFAGGALVEPGGAIVQTRAAETLEMLAAGGHDAFYRGAFAERFVQTVRDAGGVMTREDLDRYAVHWDEPARGRYRDYDVIGSPAPDDGGALLIEMLEELQSHDVRAMGRAEESPETLALLAGLQARVLAGGGAPRVGSNHLTVVDAEGNVATALHSCMSQPWSNGLYVDGIGICAGGLHFLRTMPAPGERALVPIVPAMLARAEGPVLAFGSPSTGLLACALQNVVNIVDFGDDIATSVHRPRFGGPTNLPSLWYGDTMIEANFPEPVRRGAEKLGGRFSIVSPWNFLCGSFDGIVLDRDAGTLHACADPRRAGAAGGIA